MDVEKARELLNEIIRISEQEACIDKNFLKFQRLGHQALFLLAEPVCETCGNIRLIADPPSGAGITQVNGKGLNISTCPDCQQPPAGEFIKELREQTDADEGYYKHTPPDNLGIEHAIETILRTCKERFEACDRLDCLEAEKKELLELAEKHNRQREKWYNKWLGVGSQLAKRGKAIKYLNRHPLVGETTWDGVPWKRRQEQLKRILNKEDYERIIE